jgi:hypothetical protein
MTDDLLDRSVQAYRAEYRGSALDTRAIRRDILVRAGARRRKKLALTGVALPVAATFFVSAAVAASHVGFPRLEDVERWFGVARLDASAHVPTPERLPGAPPERHVAPPPVTAPALDVEAPSEPPRNAEPAPAPSRLRSPVKSSRLRADGPERRSSSVATVEPSPRASATVADTRPNLLAQDLAAYQRAHRLHFHGGDPAAALDGWNAYLTQYPAGTFAPEARFNRAVCLLRLGRRNEARQILAPIAESRFAYGRERARALLTAME